MWCKGSRGWRCYISRHPHTSMLHTSTALRTPYLRSMPLVQLHASPFQPPAVRTPHLVQAGASRPTPERKSLTPEGFVPRGHKGTPFLQRRIREQQVLRIAAPAMHVVTQGP